MTRETYNWAVDLILDAYNEGKLEHGNCSACVLGNILNTDIWALDFCTNYGNSQSIDQLPLTSEEDFNCYCVSKERNTLKNLKTIEEKRSFLNNLYNSKGFTREELMRIEFTFENSIYPDYFILKNTKEGQFIGLTAVLKLMSTMVEEDIISEETINSNQERLVKVFEKVNI